MSISIFIRPFTFSVELLYADSNLFVLVNNAIHVQKVFLARRSQDMTFGRGSIDCMRFDCFGAR